MSMWQIFSTRVAGVALAALLSSACAYQAHATVIGDNGVENNLQEVLDGITTNPLGNSSVDVNTDQVQPDAHWTIGGSGGSIATFVIEITANAATQVFGIYDAADPTKQIDIFGGAATTGAQAVISILLDGSVLVNFVDTGINFAGNLFGFFLDPSGTGTPTWYSDSALNTDSGFDHMVAYQGKGDTIQIGGLAPGPWGANEYILGWEDQSGGGDHDYQDLVVLVESVTPVPEPGTLGLLGAGLLGLGFMYNRRRSA